jgi:hypothetical protein
MTTDSENLDQKETTKMPTKMDDVATVVATMSREEVQREIMHFTGRFKLDFTPEFLRKQTLEHLRHILLAAKLQHIHSNN